MAENKSTHVAVIGGGPGGYAAAFLAADLGMQVSLIDPDVNPGGVCLYRGCIPSKALLHIARLLHEAKMASEWGVTFGEPKLDLDKIRDFKDDVVAKLTGGVGQLAKSRKIDHIRGKAILVDAHSLEVKPVEGKPWRLNFEHAIVATGSRPATVPSLKIDSPRVMDSTSALALEDVPGSLLVVGGGYIGLELGSVYAALGSKVTVVEMLPGLLPGADRDLVNVLAKRVEADFEAVMLKTTVANVSEEKNGLKVTFEGEHPGEQTFDKMLVSVGRKPNSSGIGLETTKARTDEKGFVKVDAQRRTAEPSIYAIGDVAGEPMLAHKASHEGRTAVEAISGKKVAFEPQAIPAVVFTDPELAWCGLTETQAKEQGREVKSVRFPWAASGRAKTLGRSDGLTKLIVDPKSEQVLGAAIAGPGAGELISECVLAIEMGAVVADLGLTIHPHPTLSETVMEAADMYFGTSTHVYRPRRK